MRTFYILMTPCPSIFLFFFFNDTATTEIYTLSLHDALPISPETEPARPSAACTAITPMIIQRARECWTFVNRPCVMMAMTNPRSEEHTSELQSRSDLVCRLLLEKKKKKRIQS